MSEVNQKKSSHWVKQLYYYVVMGFSILFIAMGVFTLVRASLVRFVFTSVDDYSYISTSCEFTTSEKGQTYLSETEKANCLKREEEAKTKQMKINFESATLNGILMVLIAGVVLGLHIKYFKIRD